jgi:hypothetical protein
MRLVKNIIKLKAKTEALKYNATARNSYIPLSLKQNLDQEYVISNEDICIHTRTRENKIRPEEGKFSNYSKTHINLRQWNQ